MLFAVYDCGFRARSALEAEDSGEVRVQKIIRIVGESALGIHDISRVQLDRSSNLPRFNMPLELGLFLGAKAYGDADQQTKRCLILDSEPYRYQKYISDIAGQDIRAHGDQPTTAIELVRNWLSASGVAREHVIPSGSVLAKRYRACRRAFPKMCDELQLDPRRLTFTDDIALIVAWLDINPWAPPS
ncbi:MAG TPA: hypothetical protein VM733_13985 [Thermoanaerobaculia bacterium]|nr:hypothetical protein [Thermoanaerobaculia bacterium]